MKESCSFSEFVRLANLRASQGGHSVFRQLTELAFLMPIHKVGPGFYQMAGFWKKTSTWEEKTGHLSPSAYRKVVDCLNPAPYRKLSQNKVSESAIFQLFRIPSPTYLGYFDAVAGRDSDGDELRSVEDLARFFSKRADGEKVCFKPLEGWAGHGFEVAKINNYRGELSVLRVKTSERITVEQFAKQVIFDQHAGSSVIQSFLFQHPALEAFNPASVNTIRMWVVRTTAGELKVLLAYLRIGREGSLVDNQSSGGIVAPIDVGTGVLNAAIDGLYHHKVYTRHPDHDAAIQGEALPFFRESIEVAKAALCAFPGVRFAGTDVAITVSGPKVIEINLSPDREGAAFVGVPSSQILSVTNVG